MNEFKQTALRPKALPLISVDLIERLSDLHSSALQFNMYERQAVDQDGDIVSVFVHTVIIFVLIDDLKFVRVYVMLVYKHDVFCQTVVALEGNSSVICLNFARFLNNALVVVRNLSVKKSLPFSFGKRDTVQRFQLFSQIDDKIRFLVDWQIFIALRTEQSDELLFKIRFALIRIASRCIRHIFRNDRAVA